MKERLTQQVEAQDTQNSLRASLHMHSYAKQDSSMTTADDFKSTSSYEIPQGLSSIYAFWLRLDHSRFFQLPSITDFFFAGAIYLCTHLAQAHI